MCKSDDLMDDLHIEFVSLPVKSIKAKYQVKSSWKAEDMDKLVESIKQYGVINPIMVAPLKNDQYQWKTIYGAKRLYAARKANLSEIPAKKVTKFLTVPEEKAIDLIEHMQTESVPMQMQTKEIWNAIEDIYLTLCVKSIGTDARVCADKTGLPYGVVKDAIKVELVKQSKGGEKIYRYAQEKMIPKTKAIDIINICKKADAITVDQKKAKEFIDYVAAQDNKLQNNTLAAAKQNPGGTVGQWKKAGMELEKTKLKRASTEFTPRTYDALILAADSEGLTANEWILSTVEEKLSTQGYL